MVYKSLILFSAFFLFIVDSSGQCCSAGNPLGSNGINDGLPVREWQFLTSYKHSLSKKYFHKDHQIEVPLIEKSYYDYQSLSVSYGVLKWMNVGAEIGYFYNKTQVLEPVQGDDEIRAHGLGDMGITIRFLPFKTLRKTDQFIVSGGVRIPLGEFNEQIDGVIVPVSLQPSSGALKLNSSMYYSKVTAGRKLLLNSFALFEYSNTIEEGYFIYKYGNFLQLSTGLQYNLNRHFTLLLNLKYEFRGQDQRENEETVESSGSHLVLINPQITCNVKHGWSIMLLSDLPVYKYVNGEQLTNSYAVQVSLYKRIYF
ncbi:MAG: hypothetical protein MUC31_06200 [Bacteroidales bacterium]|jgi:hypothetical protein|nr:hypothetical protein [Bacteroidales bacterium]